MKTVSVVSIAVLAAAGLGSAQLEITSFDRAGHLTWTNAVSNATYRVEWASTADGPWQKFDVLTNFTLLSASNATVTVQVPMFYRVVWVDAPPHAGVWDYWQYDTNGTLVVTGWLRLSVETNPLTATYDLSPAVPGTLVPPPFPWYTFRGWLTNGDFRLYDPMPEGGFRWEGILMENTITGLVEYTPWVPRRIWSTFRAERRGTMDP